MSVGFEEAEPGEVLSPLDEVSAFVDANVTFMVVAEQTHGQPSLEGLAVVSELKKQAVISTEPFIKKEFFRTGDDDALIETAVGAVMTTTQNLWDTATRIRPDEPSHFKFDEDFKEVAVSAIHGTLKEISPDDAITLLGNTYENAVSNLFDKLMTSDSIVDFSLDVGEHSQRRQRLLNYGGVALASFIGTTAAYLITRKR